MKVSGLVSAISSPRSLYLAPRLSGFIPVEREIFNTSIIPIPNPLHSFSVVLMDAQI